jgi:trigger factor
LETTSKRNDEDKIELSVTIPADEVQGFINAVYKEAARARIPGFRPGKAPRRVLENHFGGKGYFQAQATDDLVKDSLPRAIDAEGYVPLDKPEVTELELVEEGSDYHYALTFTACPLLELSSYEPVQIELPGEEPTDEEIEQRIGIMLDYYVDFEDVTDRSVQEGDFLTLEIEAVRDGERVEGLSGDSVPYQLGSGGLPASFDEQLLGAAIGELREFDFELSPEGTELGDGSTPTHVVATVKAIKTKTRPDLTDAWVKEHIEFDSVDEFKSRIAESLRAQKSSEVASLKDQRITEELASRLEGEPPDLLVTQTEQGIYRDFFTSLQRNNQTLDTFLASTGTTPEAFRADVKKQAAELAAQTLALDALARHLGLEISDEEIREEFASSGADDPEDLYRQWQDNGRISEIREGLLRVKAARHVSENAEVFEPGKKPAAKKAKKPAKTEKAEKPATEAKAEKVEKGKPAAKKPAAKSTEREPGDEKAATKRKPAAKKTQNDG